MQSILCGLGACVWRKGRQQRQGLLLVQVLCEGSGPMYKIRLGLMNGGRKTNTGSPVPAQKSQYLVPSAARRLSGSAFPVVTRRRSQCQASDSMQSFYVKQENVSSICWCHSIWEKERARGEELTLRAATRGAIQRRRSSPVSESSPKLARNLGFGQGKHAHGGYNKCIHPSVKCMQICTSNASHIRRHVKQK